MRFREKRIEKKREERDMGLVIDIVKLARKYMFKINDRITRCLLAFDLEALVLEYLAKKKVPVEKRLFHFYDGTTEAELANNQIKIVYANSYTGGIVKPLFDADIVEFGYLILRDIEIEKKR